MGGSATDSDKISRPVVPKSEVVPAPLHRSNSFPNNWGDLPVIPPSSPPFFWPPPPNMGVAVRPCMLSPEQFHAWQQSLKESDAVSESESERARRGRRRGKDSK